MVEKLSPQLLVLNVVDVRVVLSVDFNLVGIVELFIARDIFGGLLLTHMVLGVALNELLVELVVSKVYTR